ncbi:MAG: hypothetical protein Q9191_006327 [Dirinaria sp. TL-2023a]
MVRCIVQASSFAKKTTVKISVPQKVSPFASTTPSAKTPVPVTAPSKVSPFIASTPSKMTPTSKPPLIDPTIVSVEEDEDENEDEENDDQDDKTKAARAYETIARDTLIDIVEIMSSIGGEAYDKLLKLYEEAKAKMTDTVRIIEDGGLDSFVSSPVT